MYTCHKEAWQEKTTMLGKYKHWCIRQRPAALLAVSRLARKITDLYESNGTPFHLATGYLCVEGMPAVFVAVVSNDSQYWWVSFGTVY